MKRLKFLIPVFALAAFFAADALLAHINPIVNSNIFVKNDFEITQHDHPEKVWDKVFFGNSVVISSYMEDKSSSGYINLGLDYGVVTDLRDMLKGGYINVGSELVVGLNYLTLYDDFDTNPTYIWHKKWYEPYAYFERDRFHPLITGMFTRLISGESVPPMTYTYQKKAVYHGRIAEAALADKMAEYDELYFSQPIEKFSENIKALEDVIGYCKKHGIRIRVIWMPWNPLFEKPALINEVHERADEVLRANGIEVLDLEDEFGPEYFYDTGHLNYDCGSERFTKYLDTWL